MTLPRSHAPAGRPAHVPHAAPPDAWRTTAGRSAVNHVAGPAVSPLAPESGRGADSGQGADWGGGADSERPHAERVWEQRRALGRRLASLRSRSGFSQWELAPLTGYSRSTLSDAELGRHRLRREFWQRCDEALMSEGVLTSAYDRIEVVATAVRRSARRQAQAAREEQASRRLQALLPAHSAEALAASGPAASGPAPAGSAPAAPASPGAAAHQSATGHPAGVTYPAATRHPPAAALPAAVTQPQGQPAPSPLAMMEQCPHCHQPVTVIIVAAATPAADSPAR